MKKRNEKSCILLLAARGYRERKKGRNPLLTSGKFAWLYVHNQAKIILKLFNVSVLAYILARSVKVRTACLFHVFTFARLRSMSWSWRSRTSEASSRSPPWGRWGCRQTRWCELCLAPNTRAPWTSEPTSSLWRRRTSNRTRYQNSRTLRQFQNIPEVHPGCRCR